MPSFWKKYGLLVIVLLLLALVLFVFYQNYQRQAGKLTFAMLDVGQGDALFIESPTGTQVLIDGGPPRKILSELSRVMPIFDRRIDAIIITNPDQDHIGGFLDVLKSYEVGMVLEPGTFNDSKTYANLEKEIKNKKIKNILVRKGMRFDLGGGAVLDILFPDRDVSSWATNDGSIVAKLTYGENSIMLTGDATAETEKIVMKEFPTSYLDVDVLKVGHHGSRTSTSEAFVRAVTPEYALISDGKGNNYGHPHQAVLDTLYEYGAQVFRTDLTGTILVKSDGKYVTIEP